MSILVVKIVMLAMMGVFALFFGLLPIKIYKYVEMQRATKLSRQVLATRFLSILSCLSGGVFLGVCLLDLLPTASEAFDQIKRNNGWNTEYPFTEVLIGFGFFITYLVEILAIHIYGFDHIDYETNRNDYSNYGNEKDIPKRPESENPQIRERFNRNEQNEDEGEEQGKRNSIAVEELKISGKNNYVRSITLVIAFTIHSCLEGFAFGIQFTMFTVTTLFFGIIAHKSVVALSIGMHLIKTHPNNTFFVISLIIAIALTSPIGGFVGIGLESAKLGEQTQNIVIAIATSLAGGTFIYITFFEILYAEHENSERKLEKWLSATAGFGFIAILMLFAH